MMFNLRQVILIALIIPFTFSCKKAKNGIDDPDTPNSGVEVLVVGSVKTNKPVLWKNGEPTYLLDKDGSGDVKDVFAWGNDIYVAGVTNEFYAGPGSYSRAAVYWKNGQKVVVDKTNDADLRRLLRAENGDLYAFGYRYNIKGHWDSMWKNGQNYTVQAPGEQYGFSSFETIGNDFYTGGSVSIKYDTHAVVWKNGKIFKRYSEPSYIAAFGVHGKDLYTYVRYQADSPTFKNGFKVFKNADLLYELVLSDEEWKGVNHVLGFQQGEDSYIALTIEESKDSDIDKLLVWKNGKKMNIQIPNVHSLTALYVKGDDVYTAVLHPDPDFDLKPVIYKNNELLAMNYDGNKSVRFNAIFVR